MSAGMFGVPHTESVVLNLAQIGAPKAPCSALLKHMSASGASGNYFATELDFQPGPEHAVDPGGIFRRPWQCESDIPQRTWAVCVSI